MFLYCFDEIINRTFRKVLTPLIVTNFEKAISLLFVEDDEILGKLVCDFLQTENIDARFASSVKEAFKIIRKPKPEIILLNWYLQDETGADFIKRLNQWGGSWSDIPILWVTSKALPGDKEACLQVGGVDYISKPFELTALLQKIKTHTKKGA